MVNLRSEFSTLWQKSGLSLEEVCSLLDYSPRTIKRWEAGDTSPRKVSILTLQNFIEDARKNGRALGGDEFRFVDLFAGIGGLRRGFDEIGGKCVFTSEWNNYAVKTYRANFPDDDEHQFNGDITRIEAKDIPKHDVLLGGFPCQPFSIAGVSKKNSLGKAHGFRCEAQGTLFFDVARIVEYHQPKAFVLENVKNLVNHDRGNTFRVIRKTLEEELGYHISYRVIDAKGFVPQHRERIFMVGFRDKNSFTLDDLKIPNPLNGPKLGTILHPEDGSEGEDGHFTDKKGKVNKRYVLSDKLWSYLQNYAEKHRKKGNGFGFGLAGPEDTSRTLSARYYKDGSEILIKRRRGNPRRLTPRECARLMGFDSPTGSDFKIPVSDTQAYKQFGNAVVVPVVTAVAKHMAPYLLQGEGADRYAQRELLEILG